MFIDKNSIQVKISGMANYMSLGNYLVEAKYGYNKLWSQDSGRNLSGTQSGTLLGIYPKITLQFAPLSKTDLELIVPILDSARQTIKYYDPFKKATVEMTTYTGDYEITNKNVINGYETNDGFSCSFIAVSKRV